LTPVRTPHAAGRLASRGNLLGMSWIPARTSLVVYFCPPLIVMLSVMRGRRHGRIWAQLPSWIRTFFWCWWTPFKKLVWIASRGTSGRFPSFVDTDFG
jgi:hypothetical protein